jgi:hypothetical protein
VPTEDGAIGQGIAQVLQYSEMKESTARANAALIAAAPDLLDALQFALDSEDVTLGDGGSILGDDIREYIKQAIAKAKGE